MTDLAQIFGEESLGSTAAERAASSKRIFVRSHMQLAIDTAKATGRRLTASEALDAFGLEILSAVADEGGVGLITDANEPSRTLRERRQNLRLSKRSLATAAGVSVEDITAAETPGAVVPIRQLEKISQTLALDERTVGLSPTSKGDKGLVTRLREIRTSEERDENFITTLTDAAWVIARQEELSDRLHADNGLKSLFGNKSSDYSAQIWLRGYTLAERTRDLLQVPKDASINSVYSLAQDMLGIPIVETALEDGVAGATILNGTARGIVLNNAGANGNVLIRRMTVAHELGHLLWDPSDRLERVRVDTSADLVRRDLRDPVESRANAFAVALLAPRGAVRNIWNKTEDFPEAVAEIVQKFGISSSAASHHLANVVNLSHDNLGRPKNAGVQIVRDWEDNERQHNLITGHVPSSRGGRFALLTLQALRRGIISLDTAASWLKIDHRLLRDLF